MVVGDEKVSGAWTVADGGRAFLRSLPVLTGSSPEFDVDGAPGDPVSLFVTWLCEAVDHGVLEPHAMTLSTVDEHGSPQARVLILKSLDERGWHFAVSSVSPKGRDLTSNPVAALTFHWPGVARQVRVSGVVVDDGAQAGADDFRHRPLGSRAMALTLRQSQPFDDTADLDGEVEKALRKLSDDPDLVPPEWVSYALVARQVEFWQGSPDRKHRRLSYRRVDGVWQRRRLWP